MDRSRAVLLACLAVLSARPGAVCADDRTIAPAARPDASTQSFDLEPWIREWCPTNPAELSSIPITPSDALPGAQDLSHPAVPLPPAVAGAAALGVGWVGLRAMRGVRRHLRRRR